MAELGYQARRAISRSSGVYRRMAVYRQALMLRQEGRKMLSDVVPTARQLLVDAVASELSRIGFAQEDVVELAQGYVGELFVSWE